MAARKRRAPGASPLIPQPPPEIQSNIYTSAGAPIIGDQFPHSWNAGVEGDLGTAFVDNGLYDYAGSLGATGGQPNRSRVVSLDGMSDIAAPAAEMNSGQLVRRNPNQQLAARRPAPWETMNNDLQGDWHHQDDEDEELEQKALLAKKEALAKKKTIPPFVQKLSSFLDDNRNSNLIRWSDSGDSFIVIDEDEFARTLIPELFKHNNYASFVRQLNMYGFHKKVGLSDNSMKASELKAKAPSEYYNKYFRRGRPELLWLIQKPSNKSSSAKRKREDDGKHGDSEDERRYVQDTGGGGGHYGGDLSVHGNTEMAMIPRTEYNSLRKEVQALQQQQKVISNVLGSIRRQNDQLYQQATAFQTLHERHENSINAILTFLATFYNRSLEGNGGANLADLFHPNMNQQQPRGNVVDVDEFSEKNFTKSPQMQMQRHNRRSLLLPAPAAKDGPGKGVDRAATLSPSALSSTGSPIPKARNSQSIFRSPAMSRSTSSSAVMNTQPVAGTTSHIQPKVETAPTPDVLQSLPEAEEVMSAIQNVNASTSQSATTPTIDLPAALQSYAQGNTPLTPQERNDVLSLMANSTSAASTNSSLVRNTNNAMVNPQPPTMPDLSQFAETQAQLDLLQKMSEEQNARVQSLQERLQPLSPSGTIPGLSDNSYFGSTANLGEPGQYDLNNFDSFIEGDDFFTQISEAAADAPTGVATGAVANDGTALPDFNLEELAGTAGAGVTEQQQQQSNINGTYGGGNDDLFGLDGSNDQSRVESLSSSAASPAVTSGDAEEEDVDEMDEKRQRV
ncbi:uncharacterized protein EI97DRAFT_79584 [Westerdykella ornata]|uniref:HSF-type DNA-binding domain-containing protein n=1 Tax=Westerdykella ornata TaxID=318751 RepID=A0A6A6JJX4_WESOR|nr:uncharacterized protein EI97DRAFT_79584 [Westerdykella ornata]KAF2275179.1 hypothetical protein EI97DRAFT_79584 [Westerdykella ornata]